ncbi:MAG: hypothetical protein ABI977_02025 [Acidobacteriota bacterium]
MKNLFGVFLCLIVAIAVAVAQQGGESKSQQPAQLPALQPTGEVLVKALLAADSAQNKRETPSAEELKKTIDQEIAKSATAPFTSTPQDSMGRMHKPGDKLPSLTLDDQIIMIDGAVYFRFGDTIYPMSGGGASGCFDPNSATRLQQARIKFAGQNKADHEKKD